MPVVHPRLIVGVARVPDGKGELHNARRCADMLCTDVPAHRREFRLLVALGGNEHDIGPRKRCHALKGHVIGIARADTDKNECAHSRLLGPDAR